MTRKESPAGNTGLAKVADQFFSDTFMGKENLVLRINICGENRHLHQARKRYKQFANPTTKENLQTESIILYLHYDN